MDWITEVAVIVPRGKALEGIAEIEIESRNYGRVGHPKAERVDAGSGILVGSEPAQERRTNLRTFLRLGRVKFLSGRGDPENLI